jgi:putative Holliday junction resolvase
MRLLALDIGEVRIGVAVSDALEIAAHPVTTIRRTGSLKRDIAAVAAAAIENEAAGIVAGLPLSLDGEIGPQAKRVLGFVKALREAVTIPVVTWDESLTSVEANERMLAMDISRAKRREMIDRIAAVILLESYLEHRRVTNAPHDSLVVDES